MRVIVYNESYYKQGACFSYYTGETEDYFVNISPGTACVSTRFRPEAPLAAPAQHPWRAPLDVGRQLPFPLEQPVHLKAPKYARVHLSNFH